jgi:cytidine deaminase
MNGDLLKMKDEYNFELVIGLVSAVGTANTRVIDLLKHWLGRAGYTVHEVKISKDVIPSLIPVSDQNSDPYKRLNDLMDAGNRAREASDKNAVLAWGAATVVFAKRPKEENSPRPAAKTAYIIDSLKRPEEVSELRLIYPAGFVLVGIHEDAARRKTNLVTGRGMTPENADKLMQRDADESAVPFGQRVNKTFHMADFFVKISQGHDQLDSDVKRMASLWFGDPFITPTFDEHAMFMAFAAALRSADMSRQVGAVVTKDSQILATGANDCPRAGGGLYWPVRNPETHCIEDRLRGRDFMRDVDSNRAEQVEIVNRLVSEGTKAEYGFDPQKLRSLLENSRLRDLTEYGRVVHAEMEALLCCSRNGLSTVGATLYCTTFPCHNCAKHIIAAGVERVVYVEPYAKSKAIEFHDDSIVPDGTVFAPTDERVQFEAFVGIGPRRFFDLFSMHLGSSYELKRKDDAPGKKSDWAIEKSQLRIQMKPTSYIELESDAAVLFDKVKQSLEQVQQ